MVVAKKNNVLKTKKTRKNVSRRMLRIMEKLSDEGHSTYKIAERLGVSHMTVYYWLKKMEKKRKEEEEHRKILASMRGGK